MIARSLITFACATFAVTPTVRAQSAVMAHGTVRVDTLWAQSLGTRKALTVYLPPSYGRDPSRRFPVLYYLHGMWGSERDWMNAGRITTTLDSLITTGQPEAIVVMPDGDDGWYTTWNVLPDLAACRADTTRKEPASSYCVPWPHYDDYVARDIVAHVDSAFRTLAAARHRGIAGLSMGGYGALSLALAYPEVFSAAASHSGVVAPLYAGPRPFAAPARYASDSAGLRQSAGNLWGVMRQAFGRDTLAWWARDPGRLAQRAQTRARAGGAAIPALMIDCGTADPYIDQNRALHATLDRLGVSHRYAEHPGAHTWIYWRAHAAESLSFLLAQTRVDRSAR